MNLIHFIKTIFKRKTIKKTPLSEWQKKWIEEYESTFTQKAFYIDDVKKYKQ